MGQYSGMWTLSQVSQAVKNQTWTGLPPSVVEYLIVAGGGGGGGRYYGGGGGAGGLLAGHTGITPGTSYFVTVGAGGAGGAISTAGTNGGVSVLVATSLAAVTGNIVALGGGGGGGYAVGQFAGVSGGSGGGSAEPGGTGVKPGGAGTSGQGNAGGTCNGNGSGGGGAGAVGVNGGTAANTFAGAGGAGIASAINGTVTIYAGGGGGGVNGTGYSGIPGGVGGGGAGAGTSGDGSAGTTNTGGGGGGGGGYNLPSSSGAGGSGIVIIRYPGTTQFFTGGTLSYANGYIIHTFYANGTLAPTTPTRYANPDYQISRSLRFNSADSAYLTRTPASATNQKTWTWSGWVKRGTLSSGQSLFSAQSTTTANLAYCYFSSGDKLIFYQYSASGSTTDGYKESTQLFRDTAAWYHIVVVVDTTQGIAADRIKLYVNGVQITSFSNEVNFTHNTNTYLNATNPQNIARNPDNTNYFNGYMADVNFIDGVALTPASFGWTNPATGVWAPLDFVGSYGTNGYNLTFSDNTNTTAATLGADSSGNGNNWTPNNFSVSAGAGNDSLVDSPTSYGTDTGVGGEVRGNYCTWNPTIKAYATHTYSDGNLVVTGPADWGTAQGTFGVTSGKWYWEVVSGNADVWIGISGSNMNLAAASTFDATGAIMYNGNGTKSIDGTDTSYGATYTTETIGVALDMTGGTVTFYKNNVSQGSINLSTSTLNGYTILPIVIKNGSTATANFGQRPFAYTAPSGFLALCTTNLPTPTIGATAATLAGKYFNAVTYTATPGTGGTVSVGFQPDLLWTKNRNNSENHFWQDSVRGFSPSTGVTKMLRSNSTAAESIEIGITCTTTSDGFTVADSVPASDEFWFTDRTYVAWNWKAGGTSVTNTSGSITSTVSANPTSGFSVVTYTGTGANATVGHGLGVAPSMIIVKSRSQVVNWLVWHTSLPTPSTAYLLLNLTDASANAPTTVWNSTVPTSSVFSLGTNASVNNSASTYVAYCFAEVAGYSKFGSYTGNGAANGPLAHTGFRPAFVMIKRAVGGSGSWYMEDSTRDTYNPTGLDIEANAVAAEAANSPTFDFLSNGFKLRTTYAGFNTSTDTYIYMAFASSPFKYSLAR